MNWNALIFDSEEEVGENREMLNQVLTQNAWAFIDREYAQNHRIRMRGLLAGEESQYQMLEKKLGCSITQEKPLLFFSNMDQVLLNCKMHHELDLFWFPHYFTRQVSVEQVAASAKVVADKLTVEEDEGYNSHISHFWGFFVSLDRDQRKGILAWFQRRYEGFKRVEMPGMVEPDRFLDTVEQMIESGKLDFYSPAKLKTIIAGNKFTSQLHEATLKNAENERFYLSKYSIFNRWYLNALYVSMILMGIPVIDRFFMNYVIAMEKYPLDEICETFLRTGEEKIWQRESCM